VLTENYNTSSCVVRRWAPTVAGLTKPVGRFLGLRRSLLREICAYSVVPGGSQFQEIETWSGNILNDSWSCSFLIVIQWFSDLLFFLGSHISGYPMVSLDLPYVLRLVQSCGWYFEQEKWGGCPRVIKHGWEIACDYRTKLENSS
jgi:hypothetical protein